MVKLYLYGPLALAYPAYVLDYYGDQLPALHELEKHVRNPWHNVPTAVRTPPPMVNVAWALLQYRDCDDEIRATLEEMARTSPAAFVRADVAAEKHELVRDLLAERVKLLHYVAVLNFKTTLPVLELRARCEGNEKAMLQLAQIDKSIIYAGWFRQRLIQRQYAGDWAFFGRLGKAIGKPVLGGTGHWHKAVVIAAYFWDEYFSQPDWPMNRIFRVFKEKRILARQDTLAAFRFRLNRAGLKNPLHNRK